MKLTRRNFLKVTTTAGGGLFLSQLGLFDLGKPKAYAEELKVKYGKETTSICPYCAVGCGVIATTKEGKLINSEGDPDHPINQGALCSKGSAIYQIVNNERRATKVLYRASKSNKWEEKDWDFAISEIAKRIKATRDATFEADVNRTRAIASLGGAMHNNEECYLWIKLMRAIGLVYLEHQARLCHSSTVAALAESFGRGAMTNHWIDIKNSDCIMIIGSNASECHPMSFRWITNAKENGAKLIVVDPRFTRSASKADIYAQMRSGCDVAFIGGIINYCLQNNLYQKEYVIEYSDASFLINPDFKLSEDIGLFSGYNPEKRSYNKATWKYQLDEAGIPKKDKTLQDPNCVFQLLKKHYSRYDVDTVIKITGTPKDIYLKVCETFCATGKPDKVATIMYSMGTTQHTNAVQMIRAYSIIQLLLGNIGSAGGGINAMRGEGNVQGSTDHALLFHILPGYLKAPTDKELDLKSYIDKYTPKSADPKSANWWQNTSKYIVSQLKAFYGDNAKPENDFCYSYLPKNSGNYSYISLFEAMYAKEIKGCLVFGQNPCVCSPNLNMSYKALENLDWLVVMDLWETETADFWKRPGANPANINTEVFLLPASSSLEKEGSITNSGRWAQWRNKAIEPLGNSKPDLQIVDRLYKELKALYEKESGTFSEAIVNLNWNYGETPDPNLVAKEINGYDVNTKAQIDGFAKLKDDGTTCCGNWIYCGSYTDENRMARRDPQDAPNNIGLYPKWSWCWPVNRRILYNKASCDTAGNPFDQNRVVVKWNDIDKKWTGDVPDGPWPPADKYPFIMKQEGFAALFGPGLADGPFPEHYEPQESPVINILSKQQNDPSTKIWNADLDLWGSPDKFPIIATSFRLTEHWQSGAMTRNLPWLCELVPDMFVEISTSLAKVKGIKHGEKINILSARGKVTCYALVTERIKPFQLNGKSYEQIALPWHFGYSGIATGDSANRLTANIGDANTMIPEYKAFLCDVIKGGK
ncbi:MAG: formate dehydrogenase-N subunit alpha [bacterium]